MRNAFLALMEKPTEPFVLSFSDFENSFVVETDATARAVKEVLSQRKAKGNIDSL